MTPDEPLEFQAQDFRENRSGQPQPPSASDEDVSSPEPDDPWMESLTENGESAGPDEAVPLFDPDFPDQENPGLRQTGDNLMQTVMESELPTVEPPEDLFTMPPEPDLSAPAANTPLPALSLDMKQSAGESERLTVQDSEANRLPPPVFGGGGGAISPTQSEPGFPVHEWEQRIIELQRQEQSLKQEIDTLQATHAQLRAQIADAQGALGRLVQEGLKELEQRKQALQISIEQLERRQERIRAEMRTTFAGVSQDLAIRIQSFKDYLVGSLQDLALSAEQLELPKPSKEPSPRTTASVEESTTPPSSTPRFAEQTFQEQTRKIRGLIDQYRNRPDYYGPPWHLRRTFEPIHAERVSNWFFTQGGRGAIRTMGSRLQNILVASATISILHTLYGDRLRTLVLAESPERLGEWRRGLQDCLGITRSDFGPERGVALLEDPETLAQKADRCVKDGLLPFIIIDETEEMISLSILQFPLWLAFAPNPQAPSSYAREW
jgi:hypothetical protein